MACSGSPWPKSSDFLPNTSCHHYQVHCFTVITGLPYLKLKSEHFLCLLPSLFSTSFSSCTKPWISVSQSWLHVRITWRALKTCLCPVPHLQGFSSHWNGPIPWKTNYHSSSQYDIAHLNSPITIKDNGFVI